MEMIASGIYPVSEVFSSYQGEGLHTGMYATFIRFAGCNLSCAFCDEPEALRPEDASWMGVEDILRMIQSPFVILTGGEPTLLPLGPLVSRLKSEGFKLHIETNATRCPDWLRGIDWVTASPKPPDYSIADGLGDRADEWKFVVTEDFSLEKIPDEALRRGKPVFLQPRGLDPISLKKSLEILRERPGLRLSVQMHKVLGYLLKERVA